MVAYFKAAALVLVSLLVWGLLVPGNRWEAIPMINIK